MIDPDEERGNSVGKSDSASRPAFSAAASFGISVNADFPCGLHQGIRIGGTPP
jgi:hypothetical protein